MKILFVTAGFLTLGIGAIGIVLPLLPTTPFLILTSILFAKGSDRFNNWFTESTFYKKHLKEFIETKTMTRKKKWTLLLFVDLMLLISFISIDIVMLRISILILVIVKHYCFHKYIKVIS